LPIHTARRQANGEASFSKSTLKFQAPIWGRCRDLLNIGVMRPSSSLQRTSVRFIPQNLHALILNKSRHRPNQTYEKWSAGAGEMGFLLFCRAAALLALAVRADDADAVAVRAQAAVGPVVVIVIANGLGFVG